MPERDFFLITCEHGGNRIPSRYRACFCERTHLLKTHRAYDRGALRLAREISQSLSAPLLAATVSRLLIDINRSPGHPRLFSEATRSLPRTEREAILQHYYHPYRSEVENCVAQALAHHARVIHVSCHSFAAELDGQARNADIGLLYDPSRRAEAALCRRWKSALKARHPALAIRMNYPYRGVADGLVTHLRRRLDSDRYLGIELEINQRQVDGQQSQWRALRTTVIDALRDASG